MPSPASGAIVFDETVITAGVYAVKAPEVWRSADIIIDRGRCRMGINPAKTTEYGNKGRATECPAMGKHSVSPDYTEVYYGSTTQS